MALVKIDWDELYPYYYFVDQSATYGEEVEILEEDLEFIRRAINDFFVAQEFLQRLIHPDRI